MAQDDAPTYKGWNVTCAHNFSTAARRGGEGGNETASSTLFNQSSMYETCSPIAYAACDVTKPADSDVPPINQQTRDFHKLALASGAAMRPSIYAPVSARIEASDGVAIAFEAAATNVTALVHHEVVFTFRLNKPGLVSYVLVTEAVNVVAYGVHPVFDTAESSTVISVSRTCESPALSEKAYAFWYYATDKYGRQTGYRSVEIYFG